MLDDLAPALQLLGVDVGASLLGVARLLYDADTMPVQHLTNYVSPERSRILMDVGVVDRPVPVKPSRQPERR